MNWICRDDFGVDLSTALQRIRRLRLKAGLSMVGVPNSSYYMERPQIRTETRAQSPL
jgi:hypothetical protein